MNARNESEDQLTSECIKYGIMQWVKYYQTVIPDMSKLSPVYTIEDKKKLATDLRPIFQQISFDPDDNASWELHDQKFFDSFVEDVIEDALYATERSQKIGDDMLDILDI